MKRYTEKIMDKAPFSEADASDFVHAIGERQLSDAEIACVLTGIQLRGVTLEELQGFRSALLDRALKPELDTTNAIDVCGTGGDGKNTFNISTTSAFVLAAMGHKVIKHGNYGVSSSCGSSNVLESLGFSFTTDIRTLASQLETQNICFLHAPLFHPTLKEVAPVRKQLGVRTLFNGLGPLVNPVQPPYQLTGTYSLELSKIYQHVLRPHREGFSVVHGMDGYDEISLTDNTRLLGMHDDRVISPEHFGSRRIDHASIASGGNIDAAAKLLRNVLRGNGSDAQTHVVAANVALALCTKEPTTELRDAFAESKKFIRSGQTAKHFNL